MLPTNVPSLFITIFIVAPTNMRHICHALKRSKQTNGTTIGRLVGQTNFQLNQPYNLLTRGWSWMKGKEEVASDKTVSGQLSPFSRRALRVCVCACGCERIVTTSTALSAYPINLVAVGVQLSVLIFPPSSPAQ